MAVLQWLTDDEVKALAERVLAPEMGDLGFSGVVVSHRDIYEEGPSLFIGAKVSGDVPAPFDPDRKGRLRRRLIEALLDRGDERFPHFSLKRDGDEPPEPEHIPVDP